MNRWASVTRVTIGDNFWINQSNIAFMAEQGDGSLIGFSTSEDDVMEVQESCDDIFASWDNWQKIQEGSD